MSDSVCVYAAGVSNSSCRDEREFAREAGRLKGTREKLSSDAILVYFSTCSIDDPDSRLTNYIAHKRAMELFVRDCGLRYKIFRLPQLAGSTPNPHTLLNYVFSRVVRSERFEIWSKAARNIIDVEDAATLAIDVLTSENAENEIVNIANIRNASMLEIVHAMEAAVGRRAIFDAIDRGASYAIDVERIRPSLERTNIRFPADYLDRTINKYYGRHVRNEA